MKIPSAFDSSAGVAIVVSGFLIACAGFIWGGTFEANGHRIGTLFDDALISMRYASNLVSGHGLVWTPGESPRVEGYTNLGWTLVMSMVLAMFSIWQATIVVSLIGVLIVLYSGFIGRSILLSVGVNPKFAHLGLIAVLSYFPFMFWTLRGMEVGLIGPLLLQCILITLNLSQINSRDDKKNVATISLLAAIAFLVSTRSML